VQVRRLPEVAEADVLLTWARSQAKDGPLFSSNAESAMRQAVEEVSSALRTLGKPDPFGSDCKVSDEFLDPVFRKFFLSLGLPEATMRKTDYHTLAAYLEPSGIDPEVKEKLDAIVRVATRARSVDASGAEG
jgi:hypothetical protein